MPASETRGAYAKKLVTRRVLGGGGEKLACGVRGGETADARPETSTYGGKNTIFTTVFILHQSKISLLLSLAHAVG